MISQESNQRDLGFVGNSLAKAAESGLSPQRLARAALRQAKHKQQ